MKDVQWRRITERLPQVPSDSILRREIELLEKLRGDGDASSSSHALKSITLGVVGTHGQIVVVHVSVAVVLREIFLQTIVDAAIGGSVMMVCHFGPKEAGSSFVEK